MLRSSLARGFLQALAGVPGWRSPASCRLAAARLLSATSDADANESAVQSMEKAGARKDLDGVLSIVEASGESFDSSAVAAALRQIETCTSGMDADERQKMYGSKTFQMLADMAVSGAGHAPPEVLASTIGALGRLGFSDEMVLDSLARHLMPGVQHLNAGQITELVEGLKSADHSPSVLLLDEVHQQMSRMRQSVPQEQARAVEEGLQHLGHDTSNLPNVPAGEQPDRIKYT